MGRPSLRDQLVHGSLDMLIVRGYTGASVGDIVATVGVPKGSFYSHFESKQDFAVEQVSRYMTLLDLESLRRGGEPAMTLIHNHFRHQMDLRVQGHLPLGCLLGTLSSGDLDDAPKLASAVRSSFDTWRAALAHALRSARDEGEIPTDRDPTNTAAALIDGFQGALVRARAYGNNGPVELFLDLTLPALTAQNVSNQDKT